MRENVNIAVREKKKTKTDREGVALQKNSSNMFLLPGFKHLTHLKCFCFHDCQRYVKCEVSFIGAHISLLKVCIFSVYICSKLCSVRNNL